MLESQLLGASAVTIAFIAIIGLPVPYIITIHVKEVQSWGTPHATPAPEVAQTIPTSKAVEKPFKPRKPAKLQCLSRCL